MSKRRRRQQQLRATTQAPMTDYSTANSQAGYGHGNQYSAPPPGYAGNGSAEDYYGGQQSGVAQPGNAYVK